MLTSQTCGKFRSMYLIVLLTLSTSGTILAQQPALKFKQAVQHDPVFDQDAYAILVPDGWKLQGEVVWAGSSPNPWPHLSVSNAEKHLAWRRLPRMFYAANVNNPNYPEGSTLPLGAEVRPQPASAWDYLKTLVIPQMIPEVNKATDVKVISQTDLPDLAKAGTEHDPLHRPMTETQIRIAYTAADGLVERIFFVALITSKQVRPDDPILWVSDVTTMRAPAGHLDETMPTFATISSSVHPLLPWFNRLLQVQQAFLTHQQEINNRILRNQADAIAERQRIMHEYAQQSSDLVSDEIHRRFEENMRAKDEMQTREMHYINNTGGYRNPSDGLTYELSAQYQFHCINGQGDILETNDPNLINQPGSDWKSMDHVN
jgi:hypothetical protein